MRALALLVIAGCQPGGLRDEGPERCLPDRPPPGEVVVAPVACSTMSLSSGESQTEDTWIANHVFRAVIRHPQSSLGLVGADGATVVDAAPWGAGDALHEAAPLVGGGWLDIDDVTTRDDGLVVRGTVVSLPDRPAATEGAPAAVGLSLEPDAPWIRFEGTDGLWLNPAGSLELLDGWLWSDFVVYGHDGDAVEDLGGAVRVHGATGLLVTDPLGALAARAGATGQRLSGFAPEATRVRLYRGDEVVGLLPVAGDGTFAAIVPAEIDGVVAEASGWANSAWSPPGVDLELPLLGSGAIELRFAWDTAVGRSVRIAWSSLDGRSGVATLGPAGGSLFLGAGVFDLEVSAGPRFWPVVTRAEADHDTTPTVVVELEPRFETNGQILAAFGVRGNRSRTWRGTDTTAVSLAHGLGADWVALAAEDEVTAATDDPTSFPRVAHTNGSWTLDREGAWEILSWPWSADLARPGHGAADTRGLTAAEGLAAARGGPARDRHTVVDVGWLEAGPTPWAADPRPEGVRLDPPGADGPSAWAAWYAWLDAAIPVTPVGPWAWVPVPDPANPTTEDVVQAFTSGRAVATTGPWLDLEADGLRPGQVPTTDDDGSVHVQVVAGGVEALDHLALVGTGGAELARWPILTDGLVVTADVSPGTWLIAVAWDDAGEGFAVTAPVWVEPP